VATRVLYSHTLDHILQEALDELGLYGQHAGQQEGGGLDAHVGIHCGTHFPADRGHGSRVRQRSHSNLGLKESKEGGGNTIQYNTGANIDQIRSANAICMQTL
jgi:hypothetical protein